MANPVIKLELMRRFRSPMAAWGIPLVVLLPGLAVISVYASSVAFAGQRGSGEMVFVNDGSDVTVLQGIGVGMFGAVAATLFVTLLVLVPAIVGGSIAGERHSQTLQPLQLTAMSPTQIVLGKLVASLAYLLVALICAAPVLVIPFLLGGLSAAQVIGAFVVLALITAELAAISLAVSAVLSRPAPAIIVSLIVCGFVTVAPFIAMGISMALASAQNPVFNAGASSLRYIAGFSPISLGAWVLTLGDDLGPDSIRTGDKIGSLLWFVVISVGALIIARKKVSAPVDRDR